jgi:phage tail-like protein
MADPNIEPAVSVRFKLKIDSCDLGVFTACEGIGVEVSVEQHEEGGNNSFVHQLPGRMKYPNVKVTRPVNADTAKIAAWLAKMSKGVERTNAQIVALTGDGEEVWHWTLTGVIPVKWTGPSLSADTAKIATETLELAHHGFLSDR